MQDTSQKKTIELSAFLLDIINQVAQATPLVEDFVSDVKDSTIQRIEQEELTISPQGLRIAAIDTLLHFGSPPSKIGEIIGVGELDATWFRAQLMRATARRERDTEDIAADDWKTSRSLGRMATSALGMTLQRLIETASNEKLNRDAETVNPVNPNGERRGYAAMNTAPPSLQDLLGGDTSGIKSAIFRQQLSCCAEHLCIVVDGLAGVPKEHRGMAVVSLMHLAAQTEFAHGEFRSLIGLVADTYK